jgi:hypothetical protein
MHFLVYYFLAFANIIMGFYFYNTMTLAGEPFPIPLIFAFASFHYAHNWFTRGARAIE